MSRAGTIPAQTQHPTPGAPIPDIPVPDVPSAEQPLGSELPALTAASQQQNLSEMVCFCI